MNETKKTSQRIEFIALKDMEGNSGYQRPTSDEQVADIVKKFDEAKLCTLTVSKRDGKYHILEPQRGCNGVLVSAGEDTAEPVAVGFRARKANGKYRYFWLYRVKFGAPATNLQTKGDSISFQTPTIEGTIQRRNKVDSKGNHPWKAEANEDDTVVDAATISGWYTAVYEPDFA